MGKGKLAKFAELQTYNHVLQPDFDEVFKKDYKLKGSWHAEFFQNKNPLFLELGCGKGEYTVGQAKAFPDKNFLGLDIKGNRIWRGAKTALEGELNNVGFLRTRIEFINSFFAENEVDEIWITFPDPQPKKALKRLTSSRFLNFYKQLLKPGSTVNLKTDSVELFDYTLALVKCNGLVIEKQTRDLYNSEFADDKILSIKTFYEKTWLKQGLTSQYIRFIIDKNKDYVEPTEEE